jgi:ketosteroid isomerase-like protein
VENRTRGPRLDICSSMNTAHEVVARFLGAFERFDLAAMMICFDAQATAFFPAEHEKQRLAGQEAIQQAFDAALRRLRAGGTQPFALAPLDLDVRVWNDTAIATFQLRSEHLGRRTLVLRRQDGCWRIVHLHASNAPLEAASVSGS